LRAWRPGRRRSEAGFGLLEVVIASGVMLTALTSMAYVTTNSFYDIAGAKQRQTAIAIADEALEQVRALPFSTVRAGNRTSDLVGDPRVLGLGTVASPYVLATTGEQLSHVPNPQPIVPIVPNLSSRTVDRVVYAIRLYVSYFDNNPALDMYTATVYVDWRSGARGARATFVRAATVVFAPSAIETPNAGLAGCAFVTIEPFSGACPASVSATATVAPGRIQVSGSGSAGPTLVDATSEIPTAKASLARGQIVDLWGTSKGGGLTLAGVPIGFPTSTSQADDDPSTGVGDYQFVSATSAPTSASAAAGPGTVTVSTTATPTVDTSESASAVAATASDVCRNPGGAVQTDGLPCHRSVGTQGGINRIAFDLTGIGLGTVPLSEVAAPPEPVVAFAKHRNTAAGSGPCGATSSVGCVYASGSRSIGRVRIGGLPSAIAGPLGFSGYLFELDNYSDGATAEVGIDAGVVGVTGPSGNARYFNGVGYTTIALSSATSFSVSTPVVSGSLGLYSVSVSSSIKHSAPTSSSPAATCLGGLACIKSSEALISSPLLATTSYTFRLLGVTVYQLSVTMDLGDLHVKASYVDPP
jgi:type II secretory pathway pseudopilin PulG